MDRYCTRCGKKLIQARRQAGFSGITGKPIFQIWGECPTDLNNLKKRIEVADYELHGSVYIEGVYNSMHDQEEKS